MGKATYTLEYLLKKLEGYNDTCPINDIRDGCITFVRRPAYLYRYIDTKKDFALIAPKSAKHYVERRLKEKTVVYSDLAEYHFTILHNHIHKNYVPKEPEIGSDCKIHPSVIMNVEGLKVLNSPDGSKLQFKHTGSIFIGDYVEIGANCIIHRGTMGKTIIANGVRMGVMNNIAHNCFIGENTVFAVGAILNGSVKIRSNCWIGSGAIIKNGVSICANTVIGAGAVVVKDIRIPGVYVGNPARYLRGLGEEDFNF